MITGNLNTTNLLLGIMAAVSVLEALLLIGVGVMAYRLYVQAMRMVQDVEARQIAPLVAKVNTLMVRVDGILLDVKEITSVVTNRTERVDAAIRSTMNRVDDTASRVRSSVSARIDRVKSLMHVGRAVVDSLFHNGHNGRRTSGDAPEETY
jgi:methyl-accepting chemotaxis protein